MFTNFVFVIFMMADMKTLALTLFFLTALLNINFFNAEKLTENNRPLIEKKKNNKEIVHKCCNMDCNIIKTICPPYIKSKLPAIKSNATNFYNSSHKKGFVIVDPILTYLI